MQLSQDLQGTLEFEQLQQKILEDLWEEHALPEIAKEQIMEALCRITRVHFERALVAIRSKLGLETKIDSIVLLKCAVMRDMFRRCSGSPLQWWGQGMSNPAILKDMNHYIQTELPISIENVLRAAQQKRETRRTCSRESELRPLFRLLERILRKGQRRNERTFPSDWESPVKLDDVAEICAMYNERVLEPPEAILLTLNKRKFIDEQRRNDHSFLQPAHAYEEPTMEHLLKQTAELHRKKSKASQKKEVGKHETMFGRKLVDPTTRHIIAASLMTLGPTLPNENDAFREKMRKLIEHGISNGRLSSTLSENDQRALQADLLSRRSAMLWLTISTKRGGSGQLVDALEQIIAEAAGTDPCELFHTYCMADLKAFIDGHLVRANTSLGAENWYSFKLLKDRLRYSSYAIELDVPPSEGRTFPFVSGDKQYSLQIAPVWHHLFKRTTPRLAA